MTSSVDFTVRGTLVATSNGMIIAALSASGCALLADLPEGLPYPSDGGGADAGSAYVEQVMQDAPAGYWRLGEKLGAAEDTSGNNRLGAYVDGVTRGVQGALTDDLAAKFGATGSYVRIDDDDVFDFAGQATFTLEAWLRADPVNAYRMVLSKGYPDEPEIRQGYELALNNDSLVVVGRMRDNDFDSPGFAFPTDGDFHHVAATYDGSLLTLYLDGNEVKSLASTNALLADDSPLTIGASCETTWGFFPGTIDEVAVYDKALDAGRIVEHFAARNAAP